MTVNHVGNKAMERAWNSLKAGFITDGQYVAIVGALLRKKEAEKGLVKF